MLVVVIAVTKAMVTMANQCQLGWGMIAVIQFISLRLISPDMLTEPLRHHAPCWRKGKCMSLCNCHILNAQPLSGLLLQEAFPDHTAQLFSPICALLARSIGLPIQHLITDCLICSLIAFSVYGPVCPAKSQDL